MCLGLPLRNNYKFHHILAHYGNFRYNGSYWYSIRYDISYILSAVIYCMQAVVAWTPVISIQLTHCITEDCGQILSEEYMMANLAKRETLYRFLLSIYLSMGFNLSASELDVPVHPVYTLVILRGMPTCSFNASHSLPWTIVSNRDSALSVLY